MFIPPKQRKLLCENAQCNHTFHARHCLLKTLWQQYCHVWDTGAQYGMHVQYVAVPRAFLTNLTSKTTPASFTSFKPGIKIVLNTAIIQKVQLVKVFQRLILKMSFPQL